MTKLKELITKHNKIFILIIFILILSILAGGTYAFNKYKENHIVSSNAVTITPTQTPTPTPTPPKENPLNGTIITDAEYETLSKNRPLAVMIPNDPQGWPDKGLNKADLIYEALTEGPIPRFMAYYWSDQGHTLLMPVRSVRTYFLQWYLEIPGAIIMHTGVADTNDPRTDAMAILKNGKVNSLFWDDMWEYDQKCKITKVSWLCSYAYLDELWKLGDKHGWTGDTWKGVTKENTWQYRDDSLLGERTAYKKDITVPFLYKNDTALVYWKYNKEENKYYRYNYLKKPFLDGSDNSQLYTKTLIVQKVSYTMTHDEKNRSIQEVIGTGKAYIFQDGNVTLATWKKADMDSKTRYYDENDTEITLERGRIWIQAIPSTQTIDY